jgi:hypothetical protein
MEVHIDNKNAIISHIGEEKTDRLESVLQGVHRAGYLPTCYWKNVRLYHEDGFVCVKLCSL